MNSLTWAMHSFRFIACVSVFCLAVLSAAYCHGGGPPEMFGYKIVREYPHDKEAFTQGLVWDRGTFIESTGLYGRSSLRRVELETGRVLRIHNLARRLFGEGAAVVDDQVVQLTWREGLGLVYDRESFEPEGEFRYQTEGWGLTYDGRWLIMSDGSDTLYRLDPVTHQVFSRFSVRDQGRPVTKLNELEFYKGSILANIWETDEIARIDPATGEVTGWLDLRGLAGSINPDREKVLNGIAWDKENDRLFVTGKSWPKLYEIEIVPRP